MFQNTFDLIILTWIALTFSFADSQLIRPIYVYEGLIRDIHDYFNNTCIILLHANPNPIETQGESKIERKMKIIEIRVRFSVGKILYVYLIYKSSV